MRAAIAAHCLSYEVSCRKLIPSNISSSLHSRWRSM